MVETFFKTIKSELIWPVSWQTRSQAENAVARYIDGFYNPIRRQSTFGFSARTIKSSAGSIRDSFNFSTISARENPRESGSVWYPRTVSAATTSKHGSMTHSFTSSAS